MLRASFMLAVIPVAVFAVAGPSRPPAPIKPVVVATEGVRMIRMDSATFHARWRPLYDVPPAIEVRYAAPDVPRSTAQDDVADTVARPAVQPRPRHRLLSKPAGMRLCVRHGMRTVYTRGGRSWRCRR